MAKILDMPFSVLDESKDTRAEMVTISTMHLAKGLEFRYVVIMACDDEVIPSQSRIEEVTDLSDLGKFTILSDIFYMLLARVRVMD